MAIICRIGLHKGRWKKSGEGCVQSRTCERCGADSVRDKHAVNYSSTYDPPGSCDLYGACECGRNTDIRTDHDWGGDRDTPWRLVCSRCGAKQDLYFDGFEGY